MKTYIRIFLPILCLTFMAICAEANNFGWLLDVAGNAEKLALDENKIVKRTKLEGNPRISVSLMEYKDAIVTDNASDLLLITNDYGRVGQWIAAYRLSSLQFIKDFGLESRDPALNLPRILIPPRGNKFYVIWWDSSKTQDFFKGGETYSVYDKKTLKKIKNLSNLPIDVHKRWSFSEDGERIYSFNFDSNVIKVHDGTTLRLTETIPIESLWDKPLYGRAIEDFKNDTALLTENIKLNKNDPNNIFYFTFNVVKKTSSVKINIKESGTGIISPDGNKLIIIEYPQRNSKVHIYDVSTGTQLKELDLEKKYKAIGELARNSITADSSKLYLLGESKKTGKNALIIIDLKTFKIITELQGIEGTDLFFFDDKKQTTKQS